MDLKKTLEYLDTKFKIATDEEKQKVINKIMDKGVDGVIETLEYLDPKYKNADPSKKYDIAQKIYENTLPWYKRIPQKMFTEGESQVGKQNYLLVQKAKSLLPYLNEDKQKTISQLIKNKQYEALLGELTKINKDIGSVYGKAYGITESNLDPVSAAIGGATGGAMVGGLTGAATGAIGAVADEPLQGGMFNLYEKTVGKKIPSVIKLPADLLAGMFAGILSESARKILTKSLSKAGTEAVSKIVDEPEISLKKINELKNTVIKNVDSVAEAKEIEKITPEQWKQIVSEITQKVREKQPPKDVVRDVVDDISDIRPEPTPREKIKEQVKKAIEQTQYSGLEENHGKTDIQLEISNLQKQIDELQRKAQARYNEYWKENPNMQLTAENISFLSFMTPQELDRFTEMTSKLEMLQQHVRGIHTQQDYQDIVRMKRLLRQKNIEIPKDATKQQLEDMIRQYPDLIEKYSGISGLTGKQKQVNLHKSGSDDVSDVIMFSGVHPTKALDAIFDPLNNLIDITDKKINKFTKPIAEKGRKVFDKYGLGFIDKDTAEDIYRLLLKSRSYFHDSVYDMKKLVENNIKNWIKNKKVSDGVVIEYLESPEFRKDFEKLADKKPELRQIKEVLDQLVNEIEDGSRELMERGYLTPEQYNKWKGRYLSRIYQIDDSLNIDATGKFKQEKIRSGRVIENIMKLPEEKRKELGYVENAPLSILKTVTKARQIIALDDFFKGLIKKGDVVNREFVVKIPNKILEENPKLPDEASPYFAAKLLKRFRDSLSKDEYKAFKREISEKIKAIESNKKELEKTGYRLLGEKKNLRFGVLSGMPVQKDFAAWLKGYTRIVDNPYETASKLDKAMSSFIAMFKMAKVPLNLFSYPRNFVSNYFQWYLSGATKPMRYLFDAIKEAATEGKWYKLAERHGLFKETFADEEIKRQLSELANSKNTSEFTKKLLKLVYNPATEKLTDIYGSIDDLWKLARFKYELETGRSKSLIDAIKAAQDAHYDYSVVGNLVRAMRDPDISRFPAAKLLASPFPTFMAKSASQVIEALGERPVRTSITMLTPLLITKYGWKLIADKYGEKKAKEIKNLTPEWLDDNPYFFPTYDGKKVRYVKIDNILPWAWMTSTISDVAHGNLSQAAKDVNAVSLPVYLLANVKLNKDNLGRPIYSDTEATLATSDTTPTKDRIKYGADVVKDVAGYLLENTIEPGTITSLRTYMKSKHPIAPRFTGIPVYEYTIDELRKINYGKYRQKEAEIRTEIARIKSQYKRGKISRDDYVKIVREKLKELKQIKRYFGGKE